MTRCPTCRVDDARVYVGAISVECPNPSCPHYCEAAAQRPLAVTEPAPPSPTPDPALPQPFPPWGYPTRSVLP